MTKRLPLFFLLASQLFVSGMLSTSILTIENKCNNTIWPVLFSWRSLVSPTGFALRSGESRAINTPSSWYGLISARTLCSNLTGNFSCVTGDCSSGQIECNVKYDWSPVTYAIFRFNDGGVNSYIISLKYGYNLPITVTPSQNSRTCMSSGCMVDLNKTCPNDRKKFSGGSLNACASACLESRSHEDCCTRYFDSKQTCKPSQYVQNFERACPFAYSYAFADNNSTFTCPNSTDYVITFCHSSIPNHTRSSIAPVGRKNNSLKRLKPILGGSAALVVLVIIIAVAVLVRAHSERRKRDLSYQNVEAVVMLKRYSYENVKKMKNSFAHVLGKGGFGTVYKGTLPDASGRDIAIKILKDSNGEGEDFINELASMSIASHVNIVSMFGFCYEGSKRAIIYEFMPNGSLEKFISDDMSSKMDWKTLYNISVGVAHGLEYLHNSCVSKIVHFDIKPQNILMDEDFCPKISDFGLAKLGKKNDSIMSMLGPRGTIGYIAPEVFSQCYGGVSHKSDVYSYGMVVLEMIGATKRERAETSRSNMYFPDWIYEDLERKETMRILGDHIIEEEEETVKKMTLVGLWCIQTNPSDRPPMKKVVEMLEGNVEAIVVPPKPLLTLPAVVAWESGEESEETSSLLTPSQLRL